MSGSLEKIEYYAFEGGGGSGLAYVGALQALRDAYASKGISMEDDQGLFKWPVKGVSGASAGAINALMMVLGYTPEETANLMIRDGVFSALFSEKIKLDYNRAVVTTKDKGTIPGWYGAATLMPNRLKGYDRLNGALKSCCASFDSPKKSAGKPQSAAASEDQFFKEGWAEKSFADYLRGATGIGETIKGDNLINSALKVLKAMGLPSNVKDLVEFYGDILLRAMMRLFNTDDIGECINGCFSNIDAPDAGMAEALAGHINDIATEKLQTVANQWTIGSSAPHGMKYWGMFITYPAALLVIIIFMARLFGRKTRAGSKSDAVRSRKDIRKKSDEKGRVVGRNENGHMITLLARIYWHNLRIDNTLEKFIALTLTNGVFRDIRLAIGMNAVGETEEEIAANREAAAGRLQAIGLQLIKKFLFSPITNKIYKSMTSGGLFQGDVLRTILVNAVFNKFYVEEVVRDGKIEDGSQQGWRLVKRPEALETTLGRLVDAAQDMAGVFEIDDEEHPKVSAGKPVIVPNRPTKAQLRRVMDKATGADLPALLHQLETLQSLQKRLGDVLSVGDLGLSGDGSADWTKATRSKNKLNSDIAKLKKKIADGDFPISPESRRMAIGTQRRIIAKHLTFDKLYEATKMDLVVTGANISNQFAVFFRKSLTPDFPVIDAVAISGSFPFLFRPTAVCYHPPKNTIKLPPKLGRKIYPGSGDPASGDQQKEFYKRYYSGYFIDGGVFNNLPVNAFNGDQSEIDSPDTRRTPQQMFTLPFNDNVLGFEVSNELNDAKCVFKSGFKSGLSERNLSAVLSKGLLGAFYSASGKSRFYDMPAEYAVVQIAAGNSGLFDMVPDRYALTDIHGFNYNKVWKFLTGEDPKISGQERLSDIYGLFDPDTTDPLATEMGASLNSSDIDTRIEGKRRVRQWKNAHKIRDRFRKLYSQ